VQLDPVVYEDFLPRSAAGIFRSNLAADGSSDRSGRGRRPRPGLAVGRARVATCTTRWTCTPPRSSGLGSGVAGRAVTPDLAALAAALPRRSRARPDDDLVGRTAGRGAAPPAARAGWPGPPTSSSCARSVRWAVAERAPFVVQGANTGLVGASVPDALRHDGVLSTARLTAPLDVHVATAPSPPGAGCCSRS
jgi:hypothetical protein